MARTAKAAWLRAAVAAGALIASGDALAQDVPEGSVVKIKQIARDDAFFYQRRYVVGLLCAVEEGGLHPQGTSKKWKGGSMTCADGQEYYFYKVAVEEGYFGVDYAAITGHPFGQPPASTSPWQVGARVQITAISADDAFATSAPGMVGQSCSVKDAPLEPSGDAWFSGQLQCDNGIDLYFYQVSVVAAGDAPAGVVGGMPASAPPVVSGTVTAGASAAGAPTSPWPAGKMVKVVDVAPADALHATKGEIVGRTCAVVEGALVDTGDGHYAGRLFCDDGKSYQTFKVKVAAP